MRLALLILALSAGAAAAAEPDITGTWDYQGRVEAARATNGNPAPATPEVQALFARRAKMAAAGVTRRVANMLCLPSGFPGMMQWKSPIVVLQTKGRITIISEHDPGNDEPRTIYMNKPMPAEVEPSWNGYSVARWEGQTLVIDTTGLNDRGSSFGVPRDGDTKIRERISLQDAGKVMIDEVTVTDAHHLTKPWTVTLKYSRMPEDTERFEAVCEPDLEALKATDLASLKDTDIEAARMLDPNLSYNPGGR